MNTDTDRIAWLESQGAHIFDKGQGDFRFSWRKEDGASVRDCIDKGIAQDEIMKEGEDIIVTLRSASKRLMLFSNQILTKNSPSKISMTAESNAIDLIVNHIENCTRRNNG